MITRIISDSSCELFDSADGQFRTAPLTISTDERSFLDDDNLNTREMLDYLSAHKGRSYTACPSIESWLSCFEGADVIYVAVMTSALSGTLNSALSAKSIYEQQHPEVKIHIFDTLTTGPELWLFIEKLEELVASDTSYDEVIRIADEYIHTTRLFFALKSLHNLAANGRINKAVASAIGILGISILSTASEDGFIRLANAAVPKSLLLLSWNSLKMPVIMAARYASAISKMQRLPKAFRQKSIKNIRRQMSSLDTAADFAATMLKKAVF